MGAGLIALCLVGWVLSQVGTRRMCVTMKSLLQQTHLCASNVGAVAAFESPLFYYCLVFYVSTASYVDPHAAFTARGAPFAVGAGGG